MFEVNFFKQEAKMKNQRSEIRNRAFIRGFTIIECLVSLAISAILLAALAVAFNAAVVNYRENERMYQTVNGARQALTRMTSQLRSAGYQVTPTLFVAVDTNSPSNQCSFYTGAGDNITYEFRSADGKLYLITNSDGHEYVLCNNVTAATFTKTLTADGLDCKSIQVSLTVRTGDVQRTLAAAAVIRRNLSL
jgi:prepilin-type N-terminal cleavage/methylation domain-containing protein